MKPRLPIHTDSQPDTNAHCIPGRVAGRNNLTYIVSKQWETHCKVFTNKMSVNGRVFACSNIYTFLKKEFMTVQILFLKYVTWNSSWIRYNV